jgi:hypothetical protein
VGWGVCGCGCGMHSLDKGREPLDKGERLTAVAICDDAAEGVGSALVEAEVGPGDEPTELNEDPGRLETQDTEYVRDADLETVGQMLLLL